MRLDRLLANSGCGTRSSVKDAIVKGGVTVNGAVIRDPAFKAEETDDITYFGESVGAGSFLYFVFDKPDEVLTAMEDKRYKSVGDYITDDIKGKHLSPVGRLDYHTTGLLLITNDGELSHKITSPRYLIPKRYLVSYEGSPFDDDIKEELSRGITLTDMNKPVKLAPCTLETRENNECVITLTEGKTHEVRRIISHYGRTVSALRRISIGPLELETVEPGSLRKLTKEEIRQLKDMF